MREDMKGYSDYLKNIRVTRCRHFKRRFGEEWRFAISRDGGLLEIQAIITRKIKPAFLSIKVNRRMLSIRALCELCARR